MRVTALTTFDEFARVAGEDPAVVGLVLIGSQAHEGLVTQYSDHDLWVILADGAASDLQSLHGYRSARLDLVVISLSQFRTAGMPGFARYALARSRVVLDRLDGEITAIITAKQRFGEAESRDLVAAHLGEYLNLLYRSAKSYRDGLMLAYRLDAAESIGPALDLLFAMDRRPRPYNKYLEWELANFPLLGWDTTALLETIGAINATGDVGLQHRFFEQIASKVRDFGLGAELDEWSDELEPVLPAATDTPA